MLPDITYTHCGLIATGKKQNNTFENIPLT